MTSTEKIIVAATLIFALLCIVILDKSTPAASTTNQRFVLVENYITDDVSLRIIEDTETHVLYLEDCSYEGGMTPLLDGKGSVAKRI